MSGQILRAQIYQYWRQRFSARGPSHGERHRFVHQWETASPCCLNRFHAPHIAAKWSIHFGFCLRNADVRLGCLSQPAPARLRLSRGAPRHTEYRHRTVRVAQTQHRAPLTRHRFPRELSPNSELRKLCCKVAVLKKREILKNV